MSSNTAKLKVALAPLAAVLVLIASAGSVFAALQRTTPKAGSHHVVGGRITAEFSGATSGAGAGTFVVHGSASGLHTGNYSGNGSARITFESTKAFAPGERVDVTLTTGISGITQPRVFTYRTRAHRGTAHFDNDLVLSLSGYGGWAYCDAAIGDINGDGMTDFAFCEVGGSRITYWINPGNIGDWDSLAGYLSLLNAKGSVTTAISSNYSLAMGDLNNDGYNDLIAGSGYPYAGCELFLYNPNTNSFGAGTTFGAASASHHAIRLGDLNGDGFLDALMCNYGGQDYYCLNNGQGGFNTPTNIGAGGWTEDAALADLDGDGDLDVVLVRGSGYGAQDTIHMGNGNGTFGAAINLGGSGTITYSVQVGDITGDGHPDIVVGSSDGVLWYANNGQGQFGNGQYIGSTAGKLVGALELGDMDGDGDLDIAMGVGDAGTGAGQSAILINDGNGAFSNSKSFGPASVSRWGRDLKLLDLDGDGDLDLISGRGMSTPYFMLNGVEIYNGTSYTLDNAGFTPRITAMTPAPHAVSASPSSNLVAVLNNDVKGVNTSTFVARGSLRGKLAGTVSGNNSASLTFNPTQNFKPGEIIESTLHSLYTETLLTIGTSTSGTASDSMTAGYVQRVRAAAGAGPVQFAHKLHDIGGATLAVNAAAATDFNGDGQLEVVLAVGGSPDVWFTVGASGPGTGTNVASASHDSRAVAAGDLDGDGTPELLIGTTTGGYIYEWNGNGFTLLGTFGGSGDSVHGLALGDLNGDGLLDVVAAVNGGQNKMFLNQGQGSFSVVNFGGSTDNSSGVALADVDLDGDLDIVVANAGQPDVVYYNDGRGAINGWRTLGATADSRAVVAEDLNGDGYPEIVVGINGGSDQVFFNDSTGSYQVNYPLTAAATDTRSVALADVDGDGDLDLLIGYAAGQSRVYLNDGTGTFTAGATVGSAGATISALVAADFDGDSDLDVLFTRPGAQSRLAYNEQWPTVGFAQAQYTVDESAGTSAITVTLSPAATHSVTLNWTATAGTATNGDDFIAASGTLTFNPGQTSRTFNVTILDDTIDEADETVTLTLSNPSQALLGTSAAALFITDNDGEPTVRFSTAAQAVNEGAGTTVTIELSNASGLSVTVNYATANGTAVAPNDYTAASGQVTIPAGQLSATVNVATAQDNIHEGDETFTIALNGPTNATLGVVSTQTLTITDDDAIPQLNFTQTTASVNEFDGTLQLTVALSHPSSRTVTVGYATVNGTASAGQDFAASQGSLTFAPGVLSQSLTISINDDNDNEGPESFTVVLSNPANAVLGSDTVVTVTILPDPADVYTTGGAPAGGGGGGGCSGSTQGSLLLIGLLGFAAVIAVYRRRRIA
ncbi:MAG: VCBS repeat-containing protein [Planctomycetes bacterium]|nr:VCBS repeat-containing protein [Planctomycetota bacterium]MCW8134517.1 VCBS repeat-containing protein [Planctomycetota bacterium]